MGMVQRFIGPFGAETLVRGKGHVGYPLCRDLKKSWKVLLSPCSSIKLVVMRERSVQMHPMAVATISGAVVTVLIPACIVQATEVLY